MKRFFAILSVLMLTLLCGQAYAQKAPLLFGLSAMERFGAITIDNQNNKLVIKH